VVENQNEEFAKIMVAGHFLLMLASLKDCNPGCPIGLWLATVICQCFEPVRESVGKRKVLLENLQDEEHPNKDHPKLWRNFASAMGSSKQEIESVKACAKQMHDDLAQAHTNVAQYKTRLQYEFDSITVSVMRISRKSVH